jgi:hypothetical protein
MQGNIDYLRENSAYWRQGVYDTPNVESYVFRIYGRVLKHEFGITGERGEGILDFGVGSGGNARFFDGLGFDIHGVDQSEIDIKRCKDRMPHRADKFLVIDPVCNSSDRWFGEKLFKVVVSFQTLYYLNNTDLQERLLSLDAMLEPGGIFIATMMHTSSWYYPMSEPSEDGLRFVRFWRDQDRERPNLVQNDHYINFTQDESDLVEKFRIFEPVHTRGYYDGVYRNDQGSEKHLVFIGRKRA